MIVTEMTATDSSREVRWFKATDDEDCIKILLFYLIERLNIHIQLITKKAGEDRDKRIVNEWVAVA